MSNIRVGSMLEESLKHIVGAEMVSTKRVDVIPYMMGQAPGTDFECFSARVPDIVVIPKTTEQVSRILSLASKSGTPVVVRGAGSSQFAGNIALEGGILVDMSKMNKIISVDERSMVVVAEGGASVYEIMRACEEKGMRYPIGPVFTSAPQIGACVSTNMTGNFINRTGRLGDLLVGLEVVLPTSEVVMLGSGAYRFGYGHYHRYVGGPDVMGIFVNAGGTMGIITKVAVRVIRKPNYVRFFSYAWPKNKVDELTAAMVEMQNRGIYNIHLFNEWTLYPRVRRGLLKLPENAHFIPLLAEDADTEEEMQVREKMMRDICDEYGGVKCDAAAVTTMGPPDYAHYNPAKAQLLARCATTYFYNPVYAFPEVYGYWEECIRKYGFWDEAHCPSWLSWADRNSMNPYPMIRFFNPVDKEELRRMEGYWRELYLGLTKLGCVPSVYGPNLPREVLEELGPAYELMKKVKKLLDPNNIMNPGVLF